MRIKRVVMVDGKYVKDYALEWHGNLGVLWIFSWSLAEKYGCVPGLYVGYGEEFGMYTPEKYAIELGTSRVVPIDNDGKNIVYYLVPADRMFDKKECLDFAWIYDTSKHKSWGSPTSLFVFVVSLPRKETLEEMIQRNEKPYVLARAWRIDTQVEEDIKDDKLVAFAVIDIDLIAQMFYYIDAEDILERFPKITQMSEIEDRILSVCVHRYFTPIGVIKKSSPEVSYYETFWHNAILNTKAKLVKDYFALLKEIKTETVEEA